MSRVGQLIQIGIVIAGILLIAGIALPLILRARLNSERINCENHLKDIGLLGVRHSSLPGKMIEEKKSQELPSGTIVPSTLAIEDRLSWYVSILNVLDTGVASTDGPKKHRSPKGLSESLTKLDLHAAWDSEHNLEVANYRLTAAICPSRVNELVSGIPQPNNYIAVGGIGTDTPKLPREVAGKKAGAFRYDTPTPLEAITDGLRQTAQFIETSKDVGPWLQGGQSTLRGVDTETGSFIGSNRPFGGCHPGGVYISFADGSISFVRETIDPAIFLAMLTIAGGEDEQQFDAP